MNKYATIWLGIIFLLALLLRLYWIGHNLENLGIHIQQDRYADYAYALGNGSISGPSFPDFDKRLFPAYPWAILVFKPLFVDEILSGLAISLLGAMGVIYLMWYLWKQLLPVLLIAFFPPMWVKQSAKVATETFFVFFSLLALLFFWKRKPFLSGVIIGICFMTRPVAVALLAAEVVMYLPRREAKQILHLISGFVISILPLFIFNAVIFGPDEILQQFMSSDRYGGLRLGFIQIGQDISIKLSLQEYKLVISGVLYFATNILSLFVLYYFRKQSNKILILFYWQIFTLLFILTFSPFTLLGDFGRYALACVPAYIMGFSLLIRAGLRKVGIISGQKSPKEAATLI
jgi:hypothetical protein